MTAASHRVTTKHIAYLAAAPVKADGSVAREIRAKNPHLTSVVILSWQKFKEDR
jgi:hypothetical protein